MSFLFLRAFAELVRQHRFLRRRDLEGLHTRVRQSPVAPSRQGAGVVEKICEAVANACIWYPTRVFCLQRSAAAVMLLRRHGVPAELVIGAQRVPFRAHAWVEVNGCVVNDKPEVRTEFLIMDRC